MKRADTIPILQVFPRIPLDWLPPPNPTERNQYSITLLLNVQFSYLIRNFNLGCMYARMGGGGGGTMLSVTSVKSDKRQFLNVKEWNTGKISLKYEEWRLTIVKNGTKWRLSVNKNKWSKLFIKVWKVQSQLFMVWTPWVQKYHILLNKNTSEWRPSKSNKVLLTECVRGFQNNALWDTHYHALLAIQATGLTRWCAKQL